MIKSDLDTIRKHMVKIRNIYRCAVCLSEDLPALGMGQVKAAFAELIWDGYRYPAIWHETNECGCCGTRGPAVIVH